jgi:HPt (histidine-containing phosphotransfer) domain-containing protein
MLRNCWHSPNSSRPDRNPAPRSPGPIVFKYKQTTQNMSDKIRVEVMKDLEALIPRFMDRRHKEIESFRAALAAGDFETLRLGGHSLKGSGGGYGFHQLTRIGGDIETAARVKDAAAIEPLLAEYADYMQRVEVTYA